MSPQKAWREKAARVSAMDWDEIRSRLRQELAKRSDSVVFRLGTRLIERELQGANGHRTVTSRNRLATIELPPSPARFFFESNQLDKIKNILRERFPREVEQTVQRAGRICAHQFDLLGFEGLDYGSVIDWHWDPVNNLRAPRRPWYKIHYLEYSEAGDHKIIWELNRHQHLVTLAQAFHLTRQEKFLTELLHEWRHWQKENPYPYGINWASSLEVAFRSLAWLWTGRLLAACPETPKSFQYDLARALALSARHIARYLSTYSSPNTHLLGEAVALFFIGTICPQLRSASEWQAQGWQVILEQAQRQVLADGMHFEQSVYYHVYALDFFLHARILASLNEIPVPEAVDGAIQKMLEALAALSQAGAPPRFGDDDGGRVFDPRRNRAGHMTDPLAIGAALYHRPDFKALSGGFTAEALWLLGPEALREFDALPLQPPPAASTALKSSGLYVMASRHTLLAPPHSQVAQQLVVDAGPQGSGSAGHGHADALSVQLSVGGDAWLGDPGSFRYISAGPERNLFRGTAAHNTLQVDRRSQAEPSGPFAWAALPAVKTEHWTVSEEFDLFAGSHDGYYRLPQPVIHRRWIFHRKPHFWLVRDVAEGAGEHDLEIFWHFAPQFVPSYTPPGFTMLPQSSQGNENSRGLAVLPVEAHGWDQEFRRSRFSAAYGIEEPAPAIRFATHAQLPTDFAVILHPVSASMLKPGVLRRMKESHADAAWGYRYSTKKGRHLFFFAGQRRPWEFGIWKSDARFVYFGMEEGEERLCAALCAGSFLEIGGRMVISASRLVERCEISVNGSRERVFCPDRDAGADCSLENLQAALPQVLREG